MSEQEHLLHVHQYGTVSTDSVKSTQPSKQKVSNFCNTKTLIAVIVIVICVGLIIGFYALSGHNSTTHRTRKSVVDIVSSLPNNDDNGRGNVVEVKDQYPEDFKASKNEKTNGIQSPLAVQSKSIDSQKNGVTPGSKTKKGDVVESAPADVGSKTKIVIEAPPPGVPSINSKKNVLANSAPPPHGSPPLGPVVRLKTKTISQVKNINDENDQKNSNGVTDDVDLNSVLTRVNSMGLSELFVYQLSCCDSLSKNGINIDEINGKEKLDFENEVCLGLMQQASVYIGKKLNPIPKEICFTIFKEKSEPQEVNEENNSEIRRTLLALESVDEGYENVCMKLFSSESSIGDSKIEENQNQLSSSNIAFVDGIVRKASLLFECMQYDDVDIFSFTK